MSFNTVYPTFHCPFCKQIVDSGVGFRVGALARRAYKIGDTLSWNAEDGPLRPEQRPSGGNIRTVGYFNCDNPKCTSWQDCFPAVQMALVTIAKDKIETVEAYDPPAQVDQFAIIEMD